MDLAFGVLDSRCHSFLDTRSDLASSPLFALSLHLFLPLFSLMSRPAFHLASVKDATKSQQACCKSSVCFLSHISQTDPLNLLSVRLNLIHSCKFNARKPFTGKVNIHVPAHLTAKIRRAQAAEPFSLAQEQYSTVIYMYGVTGKIHIPMQLAASRQRTSGRRHQ